MHRLRKILFAVSSAVVLAVLGISVADGVARIRAGAQMAESARRFLAALDADQRARAVFAFEDQERFNWHIIPRARKGLPLKEMNPAQRELAMALLRSGTGRTGYTRVETIISLESVLRELERGTGPVRDSELYYFSIFGEPAARSRWGWRFEGHHVSINFTIVNGAMVVTVPAVFGANPAEVRQGPRSGLRALAGEEDRGRELIQALDERQRAAAIFDKVAPRDILTLATLKADPLSPAGVAASAMTAAQRKLLQNLIDVYLSRMPEDVAQERMKKIRASGLGKIHFAWAGEIEPRKPHYYRVQGPTFLIEYDNTQNDANHIHSGWRDFDGDFGRDLLREHYRTTPHGN